MPRQDCGVEELRASRPRSASNNWPIFVLFTARLARIRVKPGACGPKTVPAPKGPSISLFPAYITHRSPS